MVKRKRGAVDTDSDEESQAGPSTNAASQEMAAATMPMPVPQAYYPYPTTYTHPPMVLATLPVFAASLDWKNMIEALDEDTVREILLGSVLSSPHAQTAIYYKWTASREIDAVREELEAKRDIDFEQYVHLTHTWLDEHDSIPEDELETTSDLATKMVKSNIDVILEEATNSTSTMTRQNAVRTLYKIADSLTTVDSGLSQRVRRYLVGNKALENAMYALVRDMDRSDRRSLATQRDVDGRFVEKLASLITSAKDRSLVSGLKRPYALLKSAAT